MKKLALETLAVESFSTGDAADARGTVAGHGVEATLKTLCGSLLASNPTCCPCTPRHPEI